MRIAIVTDAWQPQVNGVVTTLTRTREGLEANGHQVAVVSPADYRTIRCPTYPEIRSYHTQFPQYLRKRLPVLDVSLPATISRAGRANAGSDRADAP